MCARPVRPETPLVSGVYRELQVPAIFGQYRVVLQLPSVVVEEDDREVTVAEVTNHSMSGVVDQLDGLPRSGLDWSSGDVLSAVEKHLSVSNSAAAARSRPGSGGDLAGFDPHHGRPSDY